MKIFGHLPGAAVPRLPIRRLPIRRLPILAALGLAALTLAALSLAAVSLAAPARAADLADARAGGQVYAAHCAACHGANGRGAMPGTPDFTRADGVLTQPDAVLLDHMTNGFHSPGSALAMPPKGGDSALTARDMRDVLAYLRGRFQGRGNDGAPSGPQEGRGPGSMGPGMMGPGMMGSGMMGPMMGR